jgi:hypothetical protein
MSSYHEGTKSSTHALKVLREEATRYFTGIAATPRERRHAFVGVGWTRSSADEPYRPHFCLISNFHDSGGSESPTALPDFKMFFPIMPDGRGHAIRAVPRHLAKPELRALLDELHPLEDPQDIVAVHARAIRAVADRDTTVGKSLLAVCLPRVAIERSENSMMIVLGPRHRTARGSVYLPSDSTEVIQYAPNFVCGIGLIRGSVGPRNE